MSDASASDSLLDRIRNEFCDSPGLRLTPWRFRQRWALTPNESRAMIQQLMKTGFIRQEEDGTLVRDERWIPSQR
jgi:hypothetical protein